MVYILTFLIPFLLFSNTSYSRETKMELKEILIKLATYRDSFNLLTNKDKDGGDTSQRESSSYILLKAINSPHDDLGRNLEEGAKIDLSLLKTPNYPEGRYHRHPDNHITLPYNRPKWYSNPKNFTGDQSTILQAMMIMYGMKQEMKDLLKQRSKRLLFHFNEESYDDSEPISRKIPDPPRIIELGQFIRGTDSKLLYPFLWILDLHLIVDAILMKDNSDGDTEQKFMAGLEASNYKWPTVWGKLASKIFYSNPKNLEKIKNYFSEDDDKNGLEGLSNLFEYVFRSRQ